MTIKPPRNKIFVSCKIATDRNQLTTDRNELTTDNSQLTTDNLEFFKPTSLEGACFS